MICCPLQPLVNVPEAYLVIEAACNHFAIRGKPQTAKTPPVSFVKIELFLSGLAIPQGEGIMGEVFAAPNGQGSAIRSEVDLGPETNVFQHRPWSRWLPPTPEADAQADQDAKEDCEPRGPQGGQE